MFMAQAYKSSYSIKYHTYINKYMLFKGILYQIIELVILFCLLCVPN